MTMQSRHAPDLRSRPAPRAPGRWLRRTRVVVARLVIGDLCAADAPGSWSSGR